MEILVIVLRSRPNRAPPLLLFEPSSNVEAKSLRYPFLGWNKTSIRKENFHVTVHEKYVIER